jgi:hypothetical protein
MKQTFVFEYEHNIPFTADEIMCYLSVDGLTVTEITEPTNICEWCEKQPVEHRVCNYCLQSTQSR